MIKKIDLTNINRILIVNNLYSLVENQNIPFFYLERLLKIIDLLKILKSELLIHLNDPFCNSYAFLWAQNFKFREYFDQYINSNLNEFDSYDLIIVQGNDINKLKKIDDDRSDMPFIISLNSREEANEIDSEKPNDYNLLIESIGKELDLQKAKIALKKKVGDFFNSYIGLPIKKQWEINKNQLNLIKRTNNLSQFKSVKRILYLDDYKRRLYIGDSYLWIVNIKKNIYNLFPQAKIVINCRDRGKCNKLNKLFKVSLVNDISITNFSWENIDFYQFDIVLFEDDVTMEFMNFHKKKSNAQLYLKPIYRFLNNSGQNLVQVPSWDFSRIHSKYITKSNLIQRISRNRQNFNFRLSEEEFNYGLKWFEEVGLDIEKRICAIILTASNKGKVLLPVHTISLITKLVEKYRFNILLFEFGFRNLDEFLKKNLAEDTYDKVYVAKNLEIRNELSLFVNGNIKLVIGPCTGLMHLISGVYSFLLFNLKYEKKDLPLILVYTGDFSKFLNNYHPKKWWANPIVKVLIRASSDNKESTIPYRVSHRYDVEGYGRISGEIESLSSEMIINYILKNYPKVLHC